jgi:hypothetical protein
MCSILEGHKCVRTSSLNFQGHACTVLTVNGFTVYHTNPTRPRARRPRCAARPTRRRAVAESSPCGIRVRVWGVPDSSPYGVAPGRARRRDHSQYPGTSPFIGTLATTPGGQSYRSPCMPGARCSLSANNPLNIHIPILLLILMTHCSSCRCWRS